VQFTFSVAAKLVGIYFLYLSVLHVSSALAMDGPPLAPVLLQLVAGAVAAAVALLLIFRTALVASVVGIVDDAPRYTEGDPDAALRTGLVLIGVFVFVTRIGQLLVTVSYALTGVHFGGPGGALGRIILDSVPIALALLLVLRPDLVSRLVARANPARR
jgi:hypothetical protein